LCASGRESGGQRRENLNTCDNEEARPAKPLEQEKNLKVKNEEIFEFQRFDNMHIVLCLQ